MCKIQTDCIKVILNVDDYNKKLLVDIIIIVKKLTTAHQKIATSTMAPSTRGGDFITKKKTRRKMTLSNAKKATKTITKTVTNKKRSKRTALMNELKQLQQIDLDTTDALPHTQKHDAHIQKVCKS